MRAQAAQITDADIDSIIAKGQQATEDLNKKMQQFTENAMKFTLDGGINAYEFKDPAAEPEDTVDLKQLIGAPHLASCQKCSSCVCTSCLYRSWDSWAPNGV